MNAGRVVAQRSPWAARACEEGLYQNDSTGMFFHTVVEDRTFSSPVARVQSVLY